MEQQRSYKYRFYPTDEQKHILARTFGCCRYVYNWGLRLRTDAYYKDKERVSYAQTSARLTQLKKQEEYAWLNDISGVALQQSLRHLDRAFHNFFEGHARYPQFKKKYSLQSASYMIGAFKYTGQTITLPKMEEPLNIIWSRPLPSGCKPTSVTISKDTADRYFISLRIDEEIAPLQVSDKQVGLDLGLKSMVVLSTGETIGNPKFFVKDEKKLARAQRKLSKKRKGSKNRVKARLKVAKIHARISDRRRDFQHRLSTRIIRENQTICVESLQVKNMVKNHHLSKAISDVGWGEFVRQLEYKAKWYGRTLVRIDKWYPSSKRCFHCGHILDSLTLDIRHWTCPECGVAHDRDINAAKNILAAGIAASACGESVRPGRVKAQLGKTQ